MTPLHLAQALHAARRRPLSSRYLWVDRASWKEEVQLASGEVVVVGRVAATDRHGLPVARHGSQRRWQITFPGGAPVWESDALTQPLSLEIEHGRYFVAADIHSRLLRTEYGEPEGGVLFFRWQQDAWMRIARQDYPRNARVNLLRSPWGRASSEDAHGLVRHEDKQLRPGNELVHVPLDARIANRARACHALRNVA